MQGAGRVRARGASEFRPRELRHAPLRRRSLSVGEQLSEVELVLAES
jgi:hypothetical protein